MEQALTRIGITAVGAHLPARRIGSQELQDEVARAGELRLPKRLFELATGIRTRHLAADDEYASTLAIAAARQALDARGLDPLQLDLLVFASATRDLCEPATAHLVQAELGSRAHAFDVSNACNSFLNGIDLARAMILAGRARRALVVTGETPSRAMRRDPAGLAELRDGFAGYTFGDAGAAVVVEPVATGGILDVETETASEHWAVGGIPGGGSRHPRGDEFSYFRGSGAELREVFEKIGGDILTRVAARTGLGWDDYARVLVHQVTVPYLDRFVELTGVPTGKLVLTVPELGNVASATIGVQLARIRHELTPGDRVLLVGLGGGASLMTMVWEAS
ncbi:MULTISPECIES: 3-oxoacyl-ACP synthase III family protein [Kitasatospora]|uniref:3-oxoacyl-ACP synthase III family protein n=1 Tax=Kitasatospora TaxID=2063 RepID=UPI000C70AC81|nr:ketoacyl-ACP synthase III [Kitasatospora sp. GP30]MDH6141959.1 3-oxoacyl-[acyl-carrier-protein] synthase III [Kitasatospora sp. GP30]